MNQYIEAEQGIQSEKYILWVQLIAKDIGIFLYVFIQHVQKKTLSRQGCAKKHDFWDTFRRKNSDYFVHKVYIS